MTSLDEIIANLDQKQFIEDWNRGISFKEIKKKFGLYRETAIRVAKSLGLKEKISKLNKPAEYEFDISEFEKDWKAGISLAELAGKYNISYPEKCKKIASNLGLGIQKRYRTSHIFEKTDTYEFTKMYLDKHFTVKEIQKKFHFADPGYVSRLAKELGLPLRLSFRSSSHDSKFATKKELFKKIWMEDKSTKEIEKEFGITGLTVTNWRDKLNLPKRKIGGQHEKNRNKATRRIIEILLANDGSLTTRELIKELKLSRDYFKMLLKSEYFSAVKLVMNQSASAKWRGSSFFGNYTNDKIVYLTGYYDCLILKLAKIILSGRIAKQIIVDSSRLTALIKNLEYDEPKIRDYRDILYDLIQSQETRDIYQTRIKANLQNYNFSKVNFSLKSTDTLPVKEYHDMLSLLANSKQKIFFGRRFDSQQFIELLNSADFKEQLELLKMLFISLNFNISAPTNTFYDFIISSTTSLYYLQNRIYQNISKIDLEIFSNQLTGKKGIIITFQHVDKDLLDAYKENILIITEERLKFLLSSISFLPTKMGSTAKIMYGENKGKFVSIKKIDYERNQADVIELLQHHHLTIPIGSLKEEFEFNENYTVDDFINFLHEISKICTSETILNLDKPSEIEIIKDIHEKTKFDGKIVVRVNNHSVSLLFRRGENYIGNLNHDHGIDYCRYDLISCDCLAWLDQYNKIYLCNHIANLLFYLWLGYQSPKNISDDKDMVDRILDKAEIDDNFYTKRQIAKSKKNNKNGDEKILDVINYIDEIHFLIRISPIIEEFWYAHVENEFSKNNSYAKLYHITLCEIIDHIHTQGDFGSLDLKVRSSPSFNNSYSEADLDACIKTVKEQLYENYVMMDYIFSLKNEQRHRVTETLQLYFDAIRS